MKEEIGIVWFRNDLRIHDHEALEASIKTCSKVLPVYCFDPRHFGQTSFGFPKTGNFRQTFLMESVMALHESLTSLGSGLLIGYGKPEDVLPELIKECSATKVFAHEEATTEETEIEDAVEQKLEELGVSFETFWGSTLYHIDDLPFDIDDVPDVFTAFRKKVEKFSKVRDEIPTPNVMPPLPVVKDKTGVIPLEKLPIITKLQSGKAAIQFKGGEAAGLARMKDYFWDKDQLKVYKETRNGLLGADYSSKFSAWLANGCLSPRRIYNEVKRYEADRIANDSTYWLIFELIWRDYFRFIFCKYGNELFKLHGIHPDKLDWKVNKKYFEKWANGHSGLDFVDANMKELNETGFMSNRGRQNVASYFAKQLKLDWRMGAEYFESLLIDYDPCSNYGNWAYVSGVGNDPRDRMFNVQGQAERYDADGAYRRYWLEE